MELILIFIIIVIIVASAGVTFYFSLISNQKTFDQLKEEQKKKNDAEKKAALQEAKEKALKAKEKKRQKKAAAKEDRRSASLDSDVLDTPSSNTKKKENDVKDVQTVAQVKHNQSNNRKSQVNESKQKTVLSETIQVPLNVNIEKPHKPEKNEIKNIKPNIENVENTKDKSNFDRKEPGAKQNKSNFNKKESGEKQNKSNINKKESGEKQNKSNVDKKESGEKQNKSNVDKKESGEKQKSESKKKKEVLSENNQNIGNIPKEKKFELKIIASVEQPKEQRIKKDVPNKKILQQEQEVKKEIQPPTQQQPAQVVKKEPKIVDVKQKQPKVTAAEPAPVVKEEVKIVSKEIKKQISSVTSSPSSVKGSKKKKSEFSTILALANDKDALDVNLLMPLVAKAELSNTEIETIIEVLLNKQTSGATDWSEGRQDPLIKLKKQLEEKEKHLASEKEISKGIQAKLTELRTELNGEKHKKRQLEETITARTAELQSYAIRIKQINDEKVHQTQALQNKLNEEHLMFCQLKEKTMKDECGQAALQQDFLQQMQNRDVLIARLNESLAGMEAQMAQMAAQLQEQEAISGGLSEELNAERENSAIMRERLSFQDSHIQEIAAFRTELEHRLGQAQFEVNRLQGENKTLIDQLNIEKGDQDGQMKSLQTEINNLKETNKRLLSQVSTASEKAQQLKDENESLTAQVTANTERPAAEGRENTDDDKLETKNKTHQDEHKYLAIIEQKEHTIEALKKELDLKDKDVSQITAELTTKKNDILKLSKDISQQESIVFSLRSELKTHKSNVEELTQQVGQLTQQVEAQKKKNDELRTKNYSIMEALSATEMKLESKIKQFQESSDLAKKEAENSARQLLSRIFPQIAPKNSKDHKVWLEKFETDLNEWVKEKSNGEAEHSPGVISELEKQNAQLQSMVTNYKSIIADTEGMLNKLETHVEQEETKWSGQMATLETQLESVILERNQLDEQLKKISSNVTTSKTSSFNSKDLSEEVKLLTQSLEEEKQKTHEAAKEIQKLKSQIKIGCDSLKEEQKNVTQLQDQIAQLKKSHNEDSISIDSNGLNNNESSSSSSSSVSKKKKVSGWLRKKLKGSSHNDTVSSDDQNNSITE